jgi:spore coat protein U-like protein
MTRAVLFALALCLASIATPADALVCGLFGCSCSVTAAPLDFENISPFEGAQDADGEITVDCTGLAELFPSMVVRMQSGVHGTISQRKMRSVAGDLLNYNIYTTSTRNVIWGNGTTGSTVTVSGGILGLGHWAVTRDVYGRVSPTSATKPGAYSDTVIVRIDW